MKEWDTVFLVTSDVSDFQDFADKIRSPESTGKEAGIMASHRSAYPDWLNQINNGYALENIYPELMKRFVRLKGYHPERVRRVLQPAF